MATIWAVNLPLEANGAMQVSKWSQNVAILCVLRFQKGRQNPFCDFECHFSSRTLSLLSASTLFPLVCCFLSSRPPATAPATGVLWASSFPFVGSHCRCPCLIFLSLSLCPDLSHPLSDPLTGGNGNPPSSSAPPVACSCSLPAVGTFRRCPSSCAPPKTQFKCVATLSSPSEIPARYFEAIKE